jgi:hypothetical protein
MKKYSILFLAILGTTLTFAQKPFPQLKGHTLENKEITLPADVKGKFTIVGLASSMKAQEDLETWMQPMYTSFSDNPMYNVNMYIVPMTSGFILAGSDKIEKQIKSATDKALYKYVLIYPGEIAPVRKQLGMEEKDKPYFYIIDPRGNIVYKTSGKYTEKKMEEITDQLSE